MDSLLCGALGAILFRDSHALQVLRKWLPWAAFTAIVAFILGVGSFQIVHGPEGDLLFAETLGFSLLAVGFTSLIVHVAATDGEATFLQRFFLQVRDERFWQVQLRNLRIPRTDPRSLRVRDSQGFIRRISCRPLVWYLVFHVCIRC